MTPPYPVGAAVRWSLDPEHVQRILRTRVETAAGRAPVVQYLVHRTQDAPHHAYWAYEQELTLLEEEPSMARNTLAKQTYAKRRTPCRHCASRRTISHSPTQVMCYDCNRVSTVRKEPMR